MDITTITNSLSTVKAHTNTGMAVMNMAMETSEDLAVNMVDKLIVDATAQMPQISSTGHIDVRI